MRVLYVFPMARLAPRRRPLTQGTLNALLDDLQRHGICLTSYGNVCGAESLVARSEYQRMRKENTALDLDGVRRVMEKALDAFTVTRKWNREFGSRALRAVYMEAETWLFSTRAQDAEGRPPVDAAMLGHGEFVAALMLLGVPAEFTGGTGCALKCAFRDTLTADLALARAECCEARRIDRLLLAGESEEEESWGNE